MSCCPASGQASPAKTLTPQKEQALLAGVGPQGLPDHTPGAQSPALSRPPTSVPSHRQAGSTERSLLPERSPAWDLMGVPPHTPSGARHPRPLMRLWGSQPL